MKNGLAKLLLLFATLFALFNINCKEHFFEPYDGDHHNNDGQYNNVRNTNFIARETSTLKTASINHSRLRLIGINGNIIVQGTSKSDSVIIIVEKQVGSESSRDAQMHLSDIFVSINDFTNEILVKTTQPNETYGRNYVVNYTIYLPSNYEIFVDNVNGNIEIDSTNNLVTVSSVNGTVTLSDIFGSSSVSTVNGLIRSKQTLPLYGTINLATINGSIELNIPQNTSADFSATVVLGYISSSNLTFKNQVKSLNSMHGTLQNGEGSIILNSVNGRISVSGF